MIRISRSGGKSGLHLSPMLVFVAVQTAGGQAQKSPFQIDATTVLLHRFRTYERGAMAVSTVTLTMLPLQNVAGQIVIKSALTPNPMQQFKRPSVMLRMASGAATHLDRVAAVKALPIVNSRFQRRMTSQAVRARRLLTTDLVALGAVGYSLEALMGSRKFARRKLRPGSSSQQQ